LGRKRGDGYTDRAPFCLSGEERKRGGKRGGHPGGTFPGPVIQEGRKGINNLTDAHEGKGPNRIGFVVIFDSKFGKKKKEPNRRVNFSDFRCGEGKRGGGGRLLSLRFIRITKLGENSHLFTMFQEGKRDSWG